MSLTLSEFLSKKNRSSEFAQDLPESGGYLVFSNSGRRGEPKRFAFPFVSIEQCLKDLLNNSADWKQLKNYDETTWRDFGSDYFLDPVANALSTVQTKPVFITLSRIIEWANGSTGQNDNAISLDQSSIETAIQKLQELEFQYSPRRRSSVITICDENFSPYFAAIRTKPFILLAGISGTGKSRLVRQLAKATCSANLTDTQKPGNFEMIQVRPNWHDSTELMGYVSRITGKPEYVMTDFVRFLAKAWLFKDVPFFLCLDEMNLAPVEQYFAEYLSVIETRRKNDAGEISTDVLVKLDDSIRSGVLDALLKPYWEDAWKDKVGSESVKAIKAQFEQDGGIGIPPNLVVMGTVNMDETTFSFSRKVLDRAMTFELNEVNLRDGLSEEEEFSGSIAAVAALGRFVSASDIYSENKGLCDKVLNYLEAVNAHLENTPFKIAYRTRNEMMIYVVERMADGKTTLAAALDEATVMKILPRIEGDEQKITKKWLTDLAALLKEKLKEQDVDFDTVKSVSLMKLEQMQKRLESGYVSFWS